MGYFKIKKQVRLVYVKNATKVEKCRISIDLPANSMYNIDVRIYES